MEHPRPYSDTDLAVWLDLLRKKSDGEKITAIFDLIEIAREMADATDREIFLRNAALHLTGDTLIRAYPWDPQGS